jgi:hypothetical protein
MAAVAAAVEEGRCSPLEGERLVGFLLMAQHGLFGERTSRRRWARLRELGVPERSPAEDFAWELRDLVDRGELSAEEAEVRAGRWVLAELGAGRNPF